MTKVVDVHMFDEMVQDKINEKYDKYDFNGKFHDEFKKWIVFLQKIIKEKNISEKKSQKIFEMFSQLKIYEDHTYVPRTFTKIATLIQMIMSKLEYFYKNNKESFDIIWGYFLEFYSEELSTHCPEGVSNRAYFILELSNDYINT